MILEKIRTIPCSRPKEVGMQSWPPGDRGSRTKASVATAIRRGTHPTYAHSVVFFSQKSIALREQSWNMDTRTIPPHASCCIRGHVEATQDFALSFMSFMQASKHFGKTPLYPRDPFARKFFFPQFLFLEANKKTPHLLYKARPWCFEPPGGYAYGGSSRPSAAGSSLDCLQLLKASGEVECPQLGMKRPKKMNDGCNSRFFQVKLYSVFFSCIAEIVDTFQKNCL